MLTISKQAHDVILKISRQIHLPDTAGLRICEGQGTGSSLRVGEAPRPKKGDKLFDYEGARVFVDSEVLDRVDNGCLDVRLRDDGRLEFAHVRAAA